MKGKTQAEKDEEVRVKKESDDALAKAQSEKDEEVRVKKESDDALAKAQSESEIIKIEEEKMKEMPDTMEDEEEKMK